MLSVLIERLPFLAPSQQEVVLSGIASLLEGRPSDSYLGSSIRETLKAFRSARERGTEAHMPPELVSTLARGSVYLDKMLCHPSLPDSLRVKEGIRFLKEITESLGVNGVVHPYFQPSSERRFPLTDHFGKIVWFLWARRGTKSAEVLFREWFQSPYRQGRDQEVQGIYESEEAALRAEQLLLQRGFDVRRAPIPKGILMEDMRRASRTVLGEGDTVEWLVARPALQSVVPSLSKLFDPTSLTEKDFELPITVAGDFLTGKSEREKDKVLSRLFQRPMTWKELLCAFKVDHPKYRLGELLLRRFGTCLHILGRLETLSGITAGEFKRELFDPPPPGGLWQASADGYNPSGGYTHHTRQGLARTLHQRFLGFLFRLGVDVFDMGARHDGPYVWPHLGFDFQKPQNLVLARDQFFWFLQKKFPQDQHAELQTKIAGLQHAWDFADFEWEGQALGKEFLLNAGDSLQRTFELRFHVGDIRYGGWDCLFKKMG